MGRLKTPPATRSGLVKRSLLVFAVLLLGPAAGFGALGWNSLQREHEFRERDMNRTARDVLSARLRETVTELEQLRDRESRRHYYEYQGEFLPREQTVKTLSFQRSMLNAAPSERHFVGWFQWELFSRRASDAAFQVFPPKHATLKRDLLAAYGKTLRERLERAPESIDLRTGNARVEAYSQRVVAANEERGQLQEEIAVQNRNRAAQRGAQQVDDDTYLDNFETRSREDPVRVRYTDFRYLARPLNTPGPALIAWRMVWVPPEQAQWREIKRDRWMLQGYALDPGALLPSLWESVGSAQVIRADRLGDDERSGIAVESLPGILGAEIAGVSTIPGFVPAVFDPSLSLASRPDHAAAASAWRTARNRFLLLVAALVVVVGLGFFVVLRGVQREVGLVRRKEDFIAAITHELKTPLTGIRMYADMLREGWVQSPEAADKYATRILDETDRLGHLVNQVLDLAALERGVAAVNAQSGDMGEAVRTAVALLETKAADGGVSLETTIEPDLPAVVFDPQLVRPLVLNLVDNAIKYSAKVDTKEVRVDVRRDGERVVVEVRDRGIGITPAARKALFQPFQRGKDEMTRDAPGVGIGLALVKRYAEAHKAKLVLESEPGKGTTVQVRFPIS